MSDRARWTSTELLRRAAALLAGPMLIRGVRACRAPRLRLQGSHQRSAGGHPGVLPPDAVPPRAESRERSHPGLEPLGDDRCPVRGRPTVGVGLLTTDAPVLDDGVRYGRPVVRRCAALDRGGLGLYAFLRSEGLARPSATLGGLAVALGLIQAKIALALPFSATLAWTTVLLAVASRLMHARSWSGRLAWVTLTAVVWGQVASAHFSNGQLIGTSALFVYLLATTFRQIWARHLRWATAGAIAGLLVSALVVDSTWPCCYPESSTSPERPSRPATLDSSS